MNETHLNSSEVRVELIKVGTSATGTRQDFTVFGHDQLDFVGNILRPCSFGALSSQNSDDWGFHRPVS